MQAEPERLWELERVIHAENAGGDFPAAGRTGNHIEATVKERPPLSVPASSVRLRGFKLLVQPGSFATEPAELRTALF